MSFELWHRQTIAKISPPKTEFALWRNTLVFGLAVFATSVAYLYIRRGSMSLFGANKAFATTALFLIGLSFALSGLCYFWNFVDTKIIYRKHLGLTGFGFAMLHVIMSLFVLPQFPLEYYQSHLPTFLTGLLAILIFIFMAAISNQYAARELGGKTWRMFLRIGYLAYFAVILHFGILKYSEWLKWFATRSPLLPPLSLFGVLFATIVLFLRLALWISLSRRSLDTPTS